MSHIFISYSRRDLIFAQKIVDALAANDLDTWIDWKSIPKGEDWEQEIYHGIEEADAFLFLISSDSVASEMCNKEIEHAVRNGKRILPIFIANVDNHEVYGITGKFLKETSKEEINRRNFIFCREGKDGFNTAIADIRETINTDYEWLKYHTRLQIKALEWARTRDSSRFLRGRELREAEDQLAKGHADPQPTELHRQYLLESRRNENQQSRRIISGLSFGIVALTCLCLAAIGASVFAIQQRNVAIDNESTAISEANYRATAQAETEIQRQQAERQAYIARAGQLSAQALVQLDAEDDLAMLLSIEAYRAHESVQSRQSLYGIWNYNPKLTQILRRHTDNVLSVAYSSDGKTLLSVSADGIRKWDANTGQPIGPLIPIDSGLYVKSMAFNSDGSILAIGLSDGTIQLRDGNTGLVLGDPLKGHGGHVVSMTFSPDGKILASAGSFDRAVFLWDVDINSPTFEKPLVKPILGHTDSVESVAFSPDGKTIASGSWDKTIRLWNVKNGQPIGEPLTGHTNWVTSVAFSPDGRTLASGSLQEIRLWDIDPNSPTYKKPLGQPLSGPSNWVNNLLFSPDGEVLASGSLQDLRLWNTDRDSPFFGQPFGEPLTGHLFWVNSLVFSPDGKFLASGSYQEIRQWNVQIEQPLGNPLRGHEFWIIGLAFSPDGKTLASGASDRTIRLWDAVTREPIGEPLTGHTNGLWSIAFSPDGRILASGAADNTIRLWDVQTRKTIKELIGHTNWVLDVAFSPDGKTLASVSSDHTIRLWDVQTGMTVDEIVTDNLIGSVDFSPDGKFFATGSDDGAIRLWDAQSHQLLGEPLIGHRDGVQSLAFSPDGKILASGSADATLILWDVQTRLPIHAPLTGHVGAIDGLAFSPDGKMVASASEDATVRLWDVETGQLLDEPLTEHTGMVLSVAFSPDGQILASGSEDSTIRLWGVDPKIWIKYTCQRVGRNLTEEEWNQFLSWKGPYDPSHKTCPQWP